MNPPPPSRSARSGHVLVTGLLVLAVAFGAFALVSVAVGLSRHGDSLLYGDTLSVPVQLSPDAIGPLPSGLQLSGWVDASVEVPDPTTRQMLLTSATDFGPLVLVVAGLWLVRGLTRSVVQGDPFAASNVRRLRGIGFLLVAGAPLVALVNYLIRSDLFTSLPAFPGFAIGIAGYRLPGGALLGGLGAFILAEVFAHGLRLREDAEGTI